MANSLKNRIYRPLTVWTYVNVACFVLVIVMSLMLAALGLAYVIYNEDAFSTEQSGPLAFLFYGFSLAFRFDPLVRLLAAVTYLVWSYRAFSNLAPLRAQYLEFSPVSAVGWWFAPLANLVFPFLIMREIWQASDADLAENTRIKRREMATPDLLAIWWAAFILSMLLTSIANFLSGAGQSKESLWFPSFLVLSELVRVLAAILVIMVMIQVTRRQEKRHQTVILAPETPPPPPSFGELATGGASPAGREDLLPDHQ